MLLTVIFWVLIHCLASAFSIVLLGDRSLISGNLMDPAVIFKILINWKFILAMFLAVVARLSFVFLNNSFLNIPRLANVSTTLTSFVSLLSVVFVVAANYLILQERLNVQQLIGSLVILIGVGLMVK